jgi:O-antigen/teichoic acid export membrane protein
MSNPTGPVKQPSVRGNFAYSVLYTLLNIGFPVISFAYIARVMGPENLGLLNFAISFAAFFTLAGAMAMPLYGSREIAKARDDRQKLDGLFSELFLLNFISSLVAAALFACLFLASDRMRVEWQLFLITGSTIVFNAVTVDWLYQGLENYRFIAWRNLVFKTLSLAMLFLLVRGREDILWVAAIGVFANSGSGLAGFLAAGRFATLSPKSPRNLVRHLRSMAILSLSTLAASMYVYLDSVLLGYLAGNRPVGLFTAATRVPRVAISIVSSLGSVIIPRISYLMAHGREAEYRLMARKSLSFVYFLAFPAAGVMFVLAPRILHVLSGPGFETAIPAMRITSPLVILMGFTNFIGLQIIFPNNGEKKLLITTLISAGVDLAVNLALIPSMGQNGSALALIGAECSSAVALAIMSGGHGLGFRLVDGIAVRYASMALLASAAVHAVSRFWRAPDAAVLPAAFAAGCIVYLGGLWLLADPLLRELAGVLRGLRRTLTKADGPA